MTTGDKTKKGRVISGMRPTGRLHIGHYFGALQNWVRLQNEVVPAAPVGAGFSPSPDSPLATRHAPLSSYECFYFIADWHALTSDYADTSAIAQNTIEIMTDYLASGLDPAKSTIFLQSLVPEHAELHLLLSMVTPLGWLERIPTYKEALENVKDKDLHNYGFLGYPVLQCADIVIYSAPDIAGLYVPVGEDQVSHVEISREIVRRFNVFNGVELLPSFFEGGTNAPAYYVMAHMEETIALPRPLGWDSITSEPFRAQITNKVLRYASEMGIENFLGSLLTDIRKHIRLRGLTEPQAILTPTPRIPGLDGRKMSKSYGNAITLSESDADIRAKTKVMVTDPARKRRTDPGNPDVCPVYDWHKLFAPRNEAGEYTAEGKATLEWSATGCRTAGIGCIECKVAMTDNLIKWITPVRERRMNYEKNPKRVLELLDEGSKKARAVAQGTMERVCEAVFHWKDKRREIGGDAAKAG